MTEELELFRRRIERERAARKQAESFLEQKSLELYTINKKLKKLNDELEEKVADRTEVILRSELLYKTVVGSLKSAVLLEDETRHIILTNQNFCQMFGVPVLPEQMVGMDCSQSAEETKHIFQDPEGFVSGVNHLLENRKISLAQLLHLNDGRVLSRDYIPIFLNDKYVGHLWKYDDITEDHRVQDLIKESEEKYRGIIENMDLGIMEVNNDDIITKVYNKFCLMVGYSREELIGKKAMNLLLPDDSFRALMNEQNTNRESGISGVYEVPLRKKNGEVIWVIISGAPIVDRNGVLIGSVGVHLDVTDKRRIQEVLEEARQVAENARLKEKRFLANMSHDIRTPINAIIGLTHLLFDNELSTEQLEYLRGIKHSSDALLSLVSDVLDISKIEAGEMKMVEKPYALKSLVNSILQPFKVHLKGKPIDISYEIDKDIKNEVFGDPGFLTQILMNLLGNAEKFTSKGHILLRVNLLCKLGDYLMTEFQVIDTGIGISNEKLSSIFDSYRQADHTIKSKFGGTGLGLAIVKQLVNIHGGEISVESKEGEGTTFTFTLPLKDTGKVPEDPVDFMGKTTFDKDNSVLIVEDNELNIVYITGLLKKWKISHHIARSVAEARAVIFDNAYDLVLMDISLGDGNGFDLTRELRATAKGKNQNKPIVALSASALTDDLLEAEKAGMNDFVTKPFKPEDLHSCFEKYLKVQKMVKPVALPSSSINPSLIVEQFNGDKVFAKEMLQVFLNTVPQELLKMEESIASNEHIIAGKIAHKVKPSFGILGLKDEMEIMRLIEIAAKQGDFQKVENTFGANKERLRLRLEEIESLKI